jgi:hypothetical protein
MKMPQECYTKYERMYWGASGYYVGIKKRTGKWAEAWFTELKLGEINPDILQIQVNV